MHYKHKSSTAYHNADKHKRAVGKRFVHKELEAGNPDGYYHYNVNYTNKDRLLEILLESSKEFIENKARLFENELSHNVSKSRRSRSEGNYGYAEKNIQHIKLYQLPELSAEYFPIFEKGFFCGAVFDTPLPEL